MPEYFFMFTLDNSDSTVRTSLLMALAQEPKRRSNVWVDPFNIEEYLSMDIYRIANDSGLAEYPAGFVTKLLDGWDLINNYGKFVTVCGLLEVNCSDFRPRYKNNGMANWEINCVTSGEFDIIWHIAMKLLSRMRCCQFILSRIYIADIDIKPSDCNDIDRVINFIEILDSTRFILLYDNVLTNTKNYLDDLRMETTLYGILQYFNVSV